ncbi:hypothetical protein Tco_0792230 [Tanacetum coccineum]
MLLTSYKKYDYQSINYNEDSNPSIFLERKQVGNLLGNTNAICMAHYCYELLRRIDEQRHWDAGVVRPSKMVVYLLLLLWRLVASDSAQPRSQEDSIAVVADPGGGA